MWYRIGITDRIGSRFRTVYIAWLLDAAMIRTPGLIVLLLVATLRPVAAADPVPPIPASLVTVEKATMASALILEIEKQTGLKVTAGAVDGTAAVEPFAKMPFWEVLESLAAKTNTRLTVNGASKAITFEAGRATTVTSLDGPFRISAKGVNAGIDAATGQTRYTLALDVHWEPRFPVFRIDAQPRVTAKDDLGNALAVRETSVKTAVAGFGHTAEVRIEGLTRKATAIAQFAGEFTLTAAPTMLAFEFDDLTALPATKEKDGVKATLTKVVKRTEVWEVQVAFEYRTPPPNFESFESWTNRNTFQLVMPKKTATAEIANYDISSNDRHVAAAYRFSTKSVDLANRKGWAVRCETPAPLVEFPIRFALKDVKLP